MNSNKEVIAERGLTIARHLKVRADDIAATIATETNRCLKELVKDSFPKAIETIEFFANSILETGHTKKNELRLDPVGRVGVITPWNDPPIAFAWKVIPALFTGNTVLWKPSEHLLDSSKQFLELCHQAGFNKIEIYGFSRTDGEDLVANGNLDMIGFTGSTLTAQSILSTAFKKSLIRCHVEAGGRGVCVVSGSVQDVENTARFLARCSFYNQGQVCSKPIRYFLSANIAEQFMRSFVDEANHWKPNGDPREIQTRVGGMITRSAADDLVEQLRNTLIASGNLTSLTDEPSRGYETGVDPCVILQSGSEEALHDQEIFGPVAIFSIFDDLSEPLDHMRLSKFALENGIFSTDTDEINSFLDYSPSGLCSVNTWGSSPVGFPFGGNRQSGHGPEKCADTLKWYTTSKYIYGY